MRAAIFEFLSGHSAHTGSLAVAAPERRLPRRAASTSPHAVVSAHAIDDLVAALDQQGTTHSLMLVHDGAVVAEQWWDPYREELPHAVYSVSKSFTAMAVGLAVAEGLLGLDDRVVDLLPEDAPRSIDARLAALRVRHLLTMTTGHDGDTVQLARLTARGGWARIILGTPLRHDPGAVFVYNSGATHLLAAILARRTGMRLLDYLTPRLLEPLGIRGATWEQSPDGIDAGGWGLSLTTEDLAVFGELLRRRGDWQGRQLVPAAWIDAATAYQVASARPDSAPDWSAGYGYQFWRDRHGTYRADGAFGQFVLVLPGARSVLALTGGAAEMQPTLDLVWRHLPPGLATGPDAQEGRTRRAALRLPIVEHTPFAAQPALQIDFDDRAFSGLRRFSIDGSPARVSDLQGSFTIPFGTDGWVAGSLRLGSADMPIAASGSWIDERHWSGLIWFTTTPFRVRMSVVLDEADGAELQLETNVSFGETRLGTATGRVTRNRIERGDP